MVWFTFLLISYNNNYNASNCQVVMNGHHAMNTIMSQFDDIYDTISQYRNTSNMMIQYDEI
jgi:hypothetical protein